MRLILFGPPGAGKGTQAALLKQRLKLHHLSTGDLFRAALKAGSPVGEKARSYMRAGKLVPDAIVWGIAREGLDAIRANNFILDGYPRTVQQALWLDAYLDTHGKDAPLVVSLKVDEEAVVDRLSRRRIDKETGASYHLDYNPPPPGVPARRVIQRPDDKPEVIRQRLSEYNEQTRPVKVHYQKHGRLVEVNGSGDIEKVYKRIESVAKKKPAASTIPTL
jgi:adenylate kinase